jgi:hypothetical protein
MKLTLWVTFEQAVSEAWLGLEPDGKILRVITSGNVLIPDSFMWHQQGHFSDSHLSKESDKIHFLHLGERSKNVLHGLLVTPGTVPLMLACTLWDCDWMWDRRPVETFSSWCSSLTSAEGLAKAQELNLTFGGELSPSQTRAATRQEWDWVIPLSSCKRGRWLCTWERPHRAVGEVN